LFCHQPTKHKIETNGRTKTSYERKVNTRRSKKKNKRETLKSTVQTIEEDRGSYAGIRGEKATLAIAGGGEKRDPKVKGQYTMLLTVIERKGNRQSQDQNQEKNKKKTKKKLKIDCLKQTVGEGGGGKNPRALCNP